MADDFITPQVRNGGAGSVGVSGVNAPDYRQVQAPAQVRTDLPDNEAAARAAELHRVFTEFGRLGTDVYGQIASHEGALAGAAAGATGRPDYKEGLARLTAYGRAFNNAATGAYAIQAEAQADDAAARLRVQANNNPDTFAATYSAVRDAVLKEAHPDAVPTLTELYNKRLAQGIAALRGEQLTEQRELQRKTWDEGVERQTSKIATLQGSADPKDQAAAQDEQVKLSLMVEGGVTNGFYSRAVADSMHINAQREITSQVFETQVDRELALMAQTGNAGDVVALLERFRDAHRTNLSDPNATPILSEPEFDKLMSSAKQKLQQERMTELYAKMGQKTAAELKLEAGDRLITVLMANHTPGPELERQVGSMVDSLDLKPEVGRAVLNSIQRGQDAPPDRKAQFYAENNPDRFNWNTADILHAVNGNAKQAMELADKIQKEKMGWEGHPAIKDARAFVASEMKLPSGIALETASDEEKLAATRAQVELTKQLNAIPEAERDKEAPRVSQNVVLTMKAQDEDARAAQYQRVKSYNEKTWGPKGTSPDPDKLRKANETADAKAQAAREEAMRLRRDIK
jgi:hypothetical protein